MGNYKISLHTNCSILVICTTPGNSCLPPLFHYTVSSRSKGWPLFYLPSLFDCRKLPSLQLTIPCSVLYKAKFNTLIFLYFLFFVSALIHFDHTIQ